MNYIIGVDVGTSSTKAVLYDQDAQVITQTNHGYELHRNAAGMAEQEPEEVINAAERAIHDVAAAADLSTGKLLAVSISSANQSLLLLDKKKKPLSRLITWADSRAQRAADNLKMMTEGQQLYMKTGVPVHPMSTLTKLLWLQEDEPNLFNRAAYFADIKAYLFYRLFNEFKVDMSIASSTGLMNLKTCEWDEQALQVAGITKDQLPEIVDGTTQAVGLVPEVQEKLGVPADTPFIYGAYDGALSNIGVGATKQNTVAITIGTSAAVRVVTDHPVIDPERRLFCYAINKGLWVVGGPLNNGGDVYEWAVKHLVDSSAVKNEQVDPYTLANHVIEGVPAGAHGLLFHPFLGGERAPLWNAKARGSFFGLSQIHTRADMLRAVMEGISMNIATVFQAVRALVGEPASVTATGGFARSKVWRQMLADILNCPVNVPDSFESGCLGSVVMAMQSLGMIDSLNTPQKFIGKVSPYQPDPTAVKVYQRYTPLFQQIEEMLAPAYSEIAKLQERQNK
ncbi:gluconokinase [Limosilactobacillus agrestis]|uniref:Gluconokinase n=1 Tax=Limosilactobacillus agrestis TaxID=2759748 RepID=A0ABS8R6N3_9LACO|nr:gluconokinase [Limosilactobacillus agrestis]MBB1099563.1 gluconokinase [Limosilactobacillus agrestis]MCD7126595.1 gluconokinase [Limosilactobacillus agrestis]MCD7130434.1 gluconokinase [Limosilactobacillus agrestis]